MHIYKIIFMRVLVCVCVFIHVSLNLQIYELFII